MSDALNKSCRRPGYLDVHRQFRIVQGDRHGRIVATECLSRLWLVWWDNLELKPNVEAEIVTPQTARMETDYETAEHYRKAAAFKSGPGYGEVFFHRRTLAGFDKANERAWQREDIDYNPPDKRTFGQRLEEGFNALEG